MNGLLKSDKCSKVLSPSLAGLGSTAEQVVAAELPVKHLFKSNAFLPFELIFIFSTQT